MLCDMRYRVFHGDTRAEEIYTIYPDGIAVSYYYDETYVNNCAGDPTYVPYSIGKLTRVSYAPVGGQDASEDATLGFDLMQRPTSTWSPCSPVIT